MFGYSPKLYLEAASSNWFGLFGEVDKSIIKNPKSLKQN